MRANVLEERRQFHQSESDLFLMVYRPLLELETDCREHRIAIALRAHFPQVDPDQPSSVVKALQRDNVWHSPTVPDITDAMIRRINQRLRDGLPVCHSREGGNLVPFAGILDSRLRGNDGQRPA